MKKKLSVLLFAVLGCMLFSCTEESMLAPEPDFFEEEVQEEITDARVVNHNEIVRVLKNFQPTQKLTKSVSRGLEPEVVYNADGDPSMYVFNFPQGGFIVISAVKDLYPVLAYNTEGFFDINAGIPGFDGWMKDVNTLTENPTAINPDSIQSCRKMWQIYEKASELQIPAGRDWKPGMIDEAEYQILQRIFADSVSSWNARNITVHYLDDIKKNYPDKYEYYNDLAHSSIWPEYEPVYQQFSVVVERNKLYTDYSRFLIETRWNQTGGFNQTFGPRGTNLVNAYAGCGPVAAGQIMYYHKWPTKYNWSDMPLYYGTTTTSNFLLDLALQAGADFKDSGTGVQLDNIYKVFRANGYTCEKEGWSNNSQNKLKNEIVSGRPVLLQTPGHEYVLGGYSELEGQTVFELWTFMDVHRFRDVVSDVINHYRNQSFYINWGWGGKNDGHYSSLTGMFANNQYYSVKNYIYNIKPNK